MQGFYCQKCGQFHEELPLSFAAPAPFNRSDELIKEENSFLGTDICVIRGQEFYIRGNVEIPIVESDSVFAYSIWVSLSFASYSHVTENWTNLERSQHEGYFGWFSCRLPGYPETINLKTHVHIRNLGVVPYIELEPTNHPLAIEQRTGISMGRVQEIAEINLHPDLSSAPKPGNTSFWRRLFGGE